MIRYLGAALVIGGCGGFGFAMAAAQKREESQLRQLLRAIEFMECELQFRQTPLPFLTENCANLLRGSVSILFSHLSELLKAHAYPDASACMARAMAETAMLTPGCCEILRELGQTLGQFDLPGQLRDLQAAAAQCRSKLSSLAENRESRMRSYQTLGLCAGATLAILLI